jgi:First C2 domain of RPGR-interacting protein 1
LLTSVPHNIKASGDDLKGGDNVFKVAILGAILSKAGCNHISELNPELSNISSLVTFVVIDFYDFETAITAIGLGDKPLYKHQSKYNFT